MKSAIAAVGFLSGWAIAAAPSAAQTSDYFCYMVESDGQVVDLANLCGSPSYTNPIGLPPPPSATATPTNAAPATATTSSSSSATGDLPLDCDFSDPQSGGSLFLEVSYTFSCLALGDIRNSTMTLQLSINGETVGFPQRQAIPALAQGETHRSGVTFATFEQVPNGQVNLRLDYTVQENAF